MKKALLIAALYVATLFLLTEAHAQRPIDSLPTTMGCYRQPVPPITIIPTLHSDMSLDCILGYIYTDSLCRSLGAWPDSYRKLDSLLGRMQSWDTIRAFMRLLYRMQEYDDDLFAEYEAAAPYLAPSYTAVPGAIVYKFWERMNVVLGSKNKYNYLTMCPVIVHIRVMGVGDSYDSLCRVPVSPQQRKCVRAMVIDTIKGQHIRQGDPVPMAPNRRQALPQAENSWINIAYSPTSPKSYHRGDHIVMPLVDDSTGIPAPFRCDSCYGASAFEVGKDYLVFLSNNFEDYDGAHSYYEYVPYPTYNEEGGIFPIDDGGNVISQDDYFGYGPIVPLATFLSALETDIHSITSH